MLILRGSVNIRATTCVYNGPLTANYFGLRFREDRPRPFVQFLKCYRKAKVCKNYMWWSWKHNFVLIQWYYHIYKKFWALHPDMQDTKRKVLEVAETYIYSGTFCLLLKGYIFQMFIQLLTRVWTPGPKMREERTKGSGRSTFGRQRSSSGPYPPFPFRPLTEVQSSYCWDGLARLRIFSRTPIYIFNYLL